MIVSYSGGLFSKKNYLLIHGAQRIELTGVTSFLALGKMLTPLHPAEPNNLAVILLGLVRT